jgi:hypothetical protein
MPFTFSFPCWVSSTFVNRYAAAETMFEIPLPTKKSNKRDKINMQRMKEKV